MNYEEAMVIFDVFQSLTNEEYQALLKIIDVNKHREMMKLLETPPFEELPSELKTLVTSAIDLEDIERVCAASRKYQWICSPKGWESILFIKNPAFAEKWRQVRVRLGLKRIVKKLFNEDFQTYIIKLYNYFFNQEGSAYELLTDVHPEIYQSLLDLFQKEGTFQEEWYVDLAEFLLENEYPDLFQLLFKYPMLYDIEKKLSWLSIEYAVYFTNTNYLAPTVNFMMFEEYLKTTADDQFFYNLFALDTSEEHAFLEEVQQEAIEILISQDDSYLLKEIDREYDLFSDNLPYFLKLARDFNASESYKYLSSI